ncbi:metalloregulator ArsR/SmtB family transcription factor [bacterium]|nr:metalloregulator ArsR/SmtB family transcription factor [bacterium]
MQNQDFYLLHAEMCKTISNPKRQAILDSLREGELTVGEIVVKTGIPQANISQHLSLLKDKGIVVVRRHGNNSFYSISNPKIIEAYDLISEVLINSLSAKNKTISDAIERDIN